MKGRDLRKGGFTQVAQREIHESSQRGFHAESAKGNTRKVRKGKIAHVSALLRALFFAILAS